MHKLLERQIRRHLGVSGALPPETTALIAAVDDAYRQADADRLLSERALELTSTELLDRNRRLRAELEERRTAAESIAESKRELRLLIELCPDAIAIRTGEEIVFCNGAWAEMFGFAAAEQVIGRRMLDFFAPHERERVSDQMKALDTTGEIGPRSLRVREMVAPDGRPVLFEFSTPHRISFGGRPSSLVAGRDVTARIAAEEAERKRQQAFLDVLERMPIGVFLHRGATLLYVNSAYASAVGRQVADLVGTSIFDLLPPEERARAAADIAAKSIRRRDVVHRHLDGHDVVLEVNAGAAIEFEGEAASVTVVHDVTEERRLHAERVQMEQHLMMSDRLATVGTLAAGVAHEINNPLAFVIGNLSFLEEGFTVAAASLDPQAREELRNALAETREGAERVRQIVRSLKSFSRQDLEASGAVDVRKVVELSVKMASSEIKHRARLVLDLKNTPRVQGNDGRLGQVILNLVVNAAQAIPVGDAEHHTIRVSCYETLTHATAVEVADDGAGISPEVLTRIFDPFFTTKPIGEGTGLGLSICHGIVASMKGSIEVESTVGVGTAFRVTLPAAECSPVETASTSAPVKLTAQGRVLVVDDEALVGSTIRRMLAPEHEVRVVTSAADALAVLSTESFDVVLCDLMMPEMTGMDLYESSAVRNAGIQESFLFMTGGAFADRARSFLAKTEVRSIEKPFDPETLRTMVRECVSAARIRRPSS